MGMIQSIICSATFCIERVMTWTCCAFVLMLLMFSIVLLMIYGISVGYHYAQKELASFALTSRSTTEGSNLRSGPENRPVVRLVAINKTEHELAAGPLVEMYRTKSPKENVYMESTEAPVILLETEKPPNAPELSPEERELAKKIIGRFRRSRNESLTSTTPSVQPFFRPLKEAWTTIGYLANM